MPKIERFFAGQKVSDWMAGAFGGGVAEFTASGGTGGGPYPEGGKTWAAHKFTATGSFTVASGTQHVEVLLIGGGGAGSIGASYTESGGGGGGGGGMTTLSTTVSANGGPAGDGVYPVIVGAGGSTPGDASAGPGNYTLFGGGPADQPTTGFRVPGGDGGGPIFDLGSLRVGGSGGGGGSYGHPSYTLGAPPAALAAPFTPAAGGIVNGGDAYGNPVSMPRSTQGVWGYQGGQGGTVTNPDGAVTRLAAGGGGGGAGAIGANAAWIDDSPSWPTVPTAGAGGAGGACAANTYFDGSSITYAGGGGGAADPDGSPSTEGAGGSGGGGAAARSPGPGYGGPHNFGGNNGTANLGGGGGGTRYMPSSPANAYGGNGGAGIVIVRYPV